MPDPVNVNNIIVFNVEVHSFPSLPPLASNKMVLETF